MAPRRLVHCLVVAAISVGGVASAVAPHASAAPVVVAGKGRARVPDVVADQAQHAFASLQAALVAGGLRSFDAYYGELDSIADQIAVRLPVDPARLRAAWRSADVDHQKALLAALSQLGVPYRHNVSKEGIGFDCSGLTTYAWGRAGFTLTRQSRAQINAAVSRTATTAQAGDLMFYPGHVMMYLGIDHAIVHAPESGRNVEVGFLNQRRVKTIRFGDPTP